MRRKRLTKEHGQSKKTKSSLIISRNMVKVAGVLFLRLQVCLLNKAFTQTHAHTLVFFAFSYATSGEGGIKNQNFLVNPVAFLQKGRKKNPLVKKSRQSYILNNKALGTQILICQWVF